MSPGIAKTVVTSLQMSWIVTLAFAQRRSSQPSVFEPGELQPREQDVESKPELSALDRLDDAVPGRTESFRQVGPHRLQIGEGLGRKPGLVGDVSDAGTDRV